MCCQEGLPDEYGALYTVPELLLKMLEEKLPGIQIGRRARRAAVVANADDLTIFVTSPTGFPVIRDANRCYERASGACLNPKKSKALAIGGWSAPVTDLGIEFHSHVKILGVTFGSTIEQSMKESWTNITGKITAQAKNASARELCIAQRVQYVQACLLAKI